MKGLPTLIKLNQRELDVRRRRLSFLENRLDTLLASRAALEARLIVEQQVATGSEEVIYAYGSYASRYLTEKETLTKQIAKAEEEVAKARDAVAEAYGEVKKYELAQAARDRREQAELERAERIELDDLGLEIHRRRDDGG
ncbi:MAG: hypothetical protein CMM50_14420 [Rhodospirillaceae bacterium]|nr:hypothetical protein [Rhodospirillaceae bacterium]